MALPPSLRPIVDAVVDMVFQRLAREREGTLPAPQSAPSASGRAKRKPRKGNATPDSSREGLGDTQTELVGALADLLLSDLTRTNGSPPKARAVSKTRSKKTGVQGTGAGHKGAPGKRTR